MKGPLGSDRGAGRGGRHTRPGAQRAGGRPGRAQALHTLPAFLQVRRVGARPLSARPPARAGHRPQEAPAPGRGDAPPARPGGPRAALT